MYICMHACMYVFFYIYMYISAIEILHVKTQWLSNWEIMEYVTDKDQSQTNWA